MKQLFRLLFLIFIIGSSCALKSCTYLQKFDSGVRKTFGQVNRFQRQQKLYSRRLGLDNSIKNKDDDASGTLQKNPIQQKNMINSYGYLFEGINGVPAGSVINYQSEDSIADYYVVQDQKFRSIPDKNEVFGWHPYWMESSWERYPFELLSTLAYFSYGVDPSTGLNQNDETIQAWKTTAMIDSALVKNTRVLLTVSLHGKQNQKNFLNNPMLWNNLFSEVGKLLLLRNANGVDINFEDVPYSRSREFVTFVSDFKQSLETLFQNNNRSKPFISLTLPAVKDRENYQIRALSPLVDLFVIMGYDYNSVDLPEAVAPLQAESGLSLNNTMDYYFNQNIPVEKTILALPYYGILWNIVPKPGGKDTYQASVERKLTYSEIQNMFLDKNFKASLELDPVSMSQIYRIAFEDNSLKEIHFDDKFTLSKKYDLALQQNLKGVGIWALGYDGNRTELWELIAEYFSQDKKILRDPIAEVNGYPVQFAKRLIQNKRVFIAIIIYFTMAIVLAFILVLTDWRVRTTIYRNQVNQLMVIFIGFILLLPLVVYIQEILELAGWYIKSSWQIYIAFLLGVLSFFIATRIKFDSLKEKP